MDYSNVTRFEVIDHRMPFGKTGVVSGRVFSARECRIEESLQDGGRTLKIFVTGDRRDDGRNGAA